MPESRYQKARGKQIIAVRFRMEASADEVVARIHDSVRETDLSLLRIFGDGDRVYPSKGRNPARSASSWCAEFLWQSRTLNSGSHLEDFLARAEYFLKVPVEVGREPGGGRRNPREDLVG